MWNGVEFCPDAPSADGECHSTWSAPIIDQNRFTLDSKILWLNMGSDSNAT